MISESLPVNDVVQYFHMHFFFLTLQNSKLITHGQVFHCITTTKQECIPLLCIVNQFWPQLQHFSMASLALVMLDRLWDGLCTYTHQIMTACGYFKNQAMGNQSRHCGRNITCISVLFHFPLKSMSVCFLHRCPVLSISPSRVCEKYLAYVKCFQNQLVCRVHVSLTPTMMETHCQKSMRETNLQRRPLWTLCLLFVSHFNQTSFHVIK